MITPAQATVDDVYAWVKSTFYEFVHDVGIATDGSDGFLTDLFEPADGECNHIWTYNTDDYKYCERCQLGFEEYYNSKYNQYVSDLQTDLGTTTLTDGGVRLYHSIEKVTSTNNGINSLDWIHDGIWTTAQVNYKETTYTYVYFHLNPISAPFNGHAKGGFSFYGPPGIVHDVESFLDADVAAGKQLLMNIPHMNTSSSSVAIGIKTDVTSADKLITYGFSAYIDFVPVDGLDTLTTQNITVNSRPSSITGDYGILGDDGTIIAVDKTIVDEGHSIVYNPVTNTTYNYTDYVYDYSDRSYNLTLEDGSTMKVVYGDENITIQEGDTVYNVYYLTSGSEGGSGSGGSGDDGSGGIGGAIGGLFDVLGEIIYGLIEGTINLATKALSALTGLLDLLKQFGESIISFFGGYTDFLGAVFPFLPEETFTILNLGLILMIAAAVFKKFL